MIVTRQGTLSDIEGVLALQSKYLFSNMSEEARKYGFVTTPFTVPQLEEIILYDGLFVAVSDQNRIVAYAFAGTWNYFSQWPIFAYMVERLENISFNNQVINTQNSFQYGPICIDISFRGKGLLNQIFEEMRLVWSEKYPISITFINQINEISKVAHTTKLGWTIIDRFTFGEKHYYGLALDMKISVL